MSTTSVPSIQLNIANEEPDKERPNSSLDDKAEGFKAANVFSFLTASANNNNNFDEFDDDPDEEYASDEDEDREEGAEEEPEVEGRSKDEDANTKYQKQQQGEQAPQQAAAEPFDVGEPRTPTKDQGNKEEEDRRADDEDFEPVPLRRTNTSLMDSVHTVLHNARNNRSTGDLSKSDSAAFHKSTWKEETRVHALTDKLREQLGISDDDSLVGDYPCWLLKDILLQGHLYLTSQHVCFFAYLPRIQSTILKSGSLQKRSRRTAKYSRYWFVLRKESLSYYNNASELYFPSGVIDLRYALKAELVGGPNDKKSSTFSVLTERRTYMFRCDTPVVAREWVKALQKEIFRCRNEGDCVKVVIPTSNIIDVDESPIMEVASTLKIRAIDNEETFSIDEYVFAFFHRSSEILQSIKTNMKSMGVNTAAIDREDDYAVMPGAKETRTRRGRSRGGTLSATLSLARSLSAPGKSLVDLAATTIKRTASPHQSLRELTGKVKGLFESDEESEDSNKDTDNKEPLFSPGSASDTGKKDMNIHSSLSDSYDLLSSSESTGAVADSSAKQPRRQRSKRHLRQYPLHMVNKVTEMWVGGPKHFMYPDDDRSLRDSKHLVSEEDGQESNERFHKYFSLAGADSLVASYYCYLQKSLPIYGKLYLSSDHLCFRSLLPGTSTKMILPLVDVENVTKEKGFRFGYSGLVVVIHGHEEIFFEFGLGANRDDCEVMILREIDHAKARATSLQVQGDESMFNSRLVTYEDALEKEMNKDILPILADPQTRFTLSPPVKKYHITLLTIGSRGDVQPHIALGTALVAEGHTVRIATHKEFGPWIEKHGLEFREIAGDPALLMQIMIEHGMFSVSFLRDASQKFRSWIDELLSTSWQACQGTDILIESPSAMGGLHIAEALRIPYMRAFTMPWTRTRAYPHAFIVPEQKMGGSYNYLTYVLFDNVFWKGIAGQVNKWRKRELNLGRTNLDQMQQTRVPFLYSVSPSVFVPPVDYSDWVHVTGYWFLDEKTHYTPDPKLEEFISNARKDEAKIVYIGFGSIIVSNPKELTQAVIDSVQKAKVRCILSKGWSDRLDKDKSKSKEVEIPLPPEIFHIDSVPHDWLFPQIDAAVHHGGSGTTGASLRAGLPTIIKPFFGDQFFYAGRVEDLGVGVYLHKLNVTQFSKALWEVTHNERIISKARDIGAKIRAENGVQTAITSIYRELDYARSLIKEPSDPQPQSPGKSETDPSPSMQAMSLARSIIRSRGSSGASSDDSWTMVD